ncbi:uncharacterized protein LOC131226995 [Magnolia sinica]|uniref:uncharacterized protein LOC131226995 n=1 Tax=Magnolia sinica TaxID=86752 RepID=UPI0026592A10|nr:uncharacterized protein LOC131226995 [Magnolia sinica]
MHAHGRLDQKPIWPAHPVDSLADSLSRNQGISAIYHPLINCVRFQNYIGKLNHKNTPDFVMEFEKEHQVKWLDIHQRVRNMIRAVFESAAMVHPEMHSSYSRAMYGVDVMLDSTFQPKLLEVTYCPDFTRACKYDTRALGGGDAIRGKDFFNLVFGCLFLNESTHVSLL